MKKSFLTVCTALALSACGTSAEPDYFSLAAAPGKVAPDINTTIKISRPTLPAYLDRPDFVRQKSDYQLEIDESDNWAEPVDKMFSRVLIEDLRQRLPAATIISEDNPAAPARFSVMMDVQHFNETSDGEVLLQGELTIRDRNAPQAMQHTLIAITAKTGWGAESIVANLSSLVGGLADQTRASLCQINPSWASCTAEHCQPKN